MLFYLDSHNSDFEAPVTRHGRGQVYKLIEALSKLSLLSLSFSI